MTDEQGRGYRDRADAGRMLADALRTELPDLRKKEADALVLAIPRGGLPVGYEVARALDLDLDLMMVRKVGLPVQPELAMGAIASGGIRVLNTDVVGMADVDDEVFDRVAARETEELERRERVYRGDHPPPELGDRTVILVDDGVATGSTLLAAVRAVRTRDPKRVVVAVPVASREASGKIRAEADRFVCPLVPEHFSAISQWYHEFPQLTDEEVQAILSEAWSRRDDGTTEGEEGLRLPGEPEDPEDVSSRKETSSAGQHRRRSDREDSEASKS